MFFKKKSEEPKKEFKIVHDIRMIVRYTNGASNTISAGEEFKSKCIKGFTWRQYKQAWLWYYIRTNSTVFYIESGNKSITLKRCEVKSIEFEPYEKEVINE